MELGPTMVSQATSPMMPAGGAPGPLAPTLEPRSAKESSIVQLNVGGHVFSTTRDTLLAAGDSFFAGLIGGEFGVHTDAQGLPFIDRDPKLFRYCLNYLRSQCTSLNMEHESRGKLLAVLGEAEFYQISSLIDDLKARIIELDKAETIQAAKHKAASRGRSRPRDTSRGPSAPGGAANRPPADGPEGTGEGSPTRTPLGEESDMSGSEDEDGERRRTPLSQGSYVEAEHADLISQAALNMDVDF
mmetsp:Transcript_13982/g.34144  ORF Transcript_13982/g.34144 Transcript_13982/m.34144 type:complete len:244 (+) Transcript_13982:200-931(+)